MADVKISGLPASTTPLAGTEVLPIVQGGQTRQVSVDNLTAGKAVSATTMTLANNLAFSGTGNRITGDFTTATIANRVAFQTSTTNSATAVVAIPNGTASSARFIAYNNSDPTNAASLGMFSVGSLTGLDSGITGTGTYLPLAIFTGGGEKIRVFTTGGVSIGNTTDPGAGNLSVTGTVRTQGYTVATLPAAGVAGRRAYVTDAVLPTYLGALTGGGAVVCPVFDNGTAWVSA